MITGKVYYITNPYSDEGRTTANLEIPKSGREKRRETRKKKRKAKNKIVTF
jgi:hypothetical protein